jgi:hypothetical protein
MLMKHDLRRVASIEDLRSLADGKQHKIAKAGATACESETNAVGRATFAVLHTGAAPQA